MKNAIMNIKIIFTKLPNQPMKRSKQFVIEYKFFYISLNNYVTSWERDSGILAK